MKIKKSKSSVPENTSPKAVESGCEPGLTRRDALKDISVLGLGFLGFGGLFTKFNTSAAPLFDLQDNCTSQCYGTVTCNQVSNTNGTLACPPFSGCGSSICRETITCLGGFNCTGQISCADTVACSPSGISCTGGKVSCLTNANIILPVTLSMFSTFVVDGAVRVQWRTMTEVNTAGFNVLRSASRDGKFRRLNDALISGHGNSNIAHEYFYVDQQINQDTFYWYMLEEIDNSGKVELHGPISCKTENALVENFTVNPNFPNPFNSETAISFILPDAGNVTIDIFDMLGNRILRNSLPGVRGPNSWSWNAKNSKGQAVHSGTYICEITFKHQAKRRKLNYIK